MKARDLKPGDCYMSEPDEDVIVRQASRRGDSVDVRTHRGERETMPADTDVAPGQWLPITPTDSLALYAILLQVAAMREVCLEWQAGRIAATAAMDRIGVMLDGYDHRADTLCDYLLRGSLG